MSAVNEVREKKSISYTCPHCQESVYVPESMMGEVVDCSACHLRFRADVPSARPNDDVRDSKSIRKESRVVDMAEETVLKKIHPALFRSHLFTTMFFWLLMLSGVAFLTFGLIMGFEPTTTLGGGAAALVGFLCLMYRWIKKRALTLILTSERVVYRKGILSKRTSEVRYEDIRNLQVDLSLRERLFRFGDLEISSAGQDDMEIVVNDIPDPEGVADFIRSRQ